MNSDCVSKASHEIDAIGAIDELCSYIGVLKQELRNHEEKDALVTILGDLFSINSIISGLGSNNEKTPDFNSERVKFVEDEINKYEKELPEVNKFILSFDDSVAAKCNFARSICRRAERNVFVLGDKKELPESVTAYMNRLSDLLFILARWNNRDAEVEEWDS